jgi:Transposase
MDILDERCCGLDIPKRSVVACRLGPGPAGVPTKEIRPFGTMTADLLALGDWLAAAGCTPGALESPGVYWEPVWNLLEGQFALLLVNAQHIKTVPGRKTDTKDSEWLADLLRHGLLPSATAAPSHQGSPASHSSAAASAKTASAPASRPRRSRGSRIPTAVLSPPREAWAAGRFAPMGGGAHGEAAAPGGRG